MRAPSFFIVCLSLGLTAASLKPVFSVLLTPGSGSHQAGNSVLDEGSAERGAKGALIGYEAIAQKQPFNPLQKVKDALYAVYGAPATGSGIAHGANRLSANIGLNPQSAPRIELEAGLFPAPYRAGAGFEDREALEETGGGRKASFGSKESAEEHSAANQKAFDSHWSGAETTSPVSLPAGGTSGAGSNPTALGAPLAQAENAGYTPKHGDRAGAAMNSTLRGDASLFDLGTAGQGSETASGSVVTMMSASVSSKGLPFSSSNSFEEELALGGVASIPEPTLFSLCAAGGLAFMLLRQRRKEA